MISLFKILSELQINKPRKFHPGQKVLLDKTLLIISSHPTAYYTEEFGSPAYIVNNPKTGERWYQDEKDLVKYKENLDELEINHPFPTTDKKTVFQYFKDNIDRDGGGYVGCDKLREQYARLREKYADENGLSRYRKETRNLINRLPQHILNRFYAEMKKLVRECVK